MYYVNYAPWTISKLMIMIWFYINFPPQSKFLNETSRNAEKCFKFLEDPSIPFPTKKGDFFTLSQENILKQEVVNFIHLLIFRQEPVIGDDGDDEGLKVPKYK